ncbi:MAG: hypothetical protein JWM51_1373 [Microbacteriaceae bacterium]|jgi:hypothetical protein|nr:hypothetical protein [Microbacteriaceae bacterium]
MRHLSIAGNVERPLGGPTTPMPASALELQALRHRLGTAQDED